MSANLPVSPSLRQLKAQAKELHKNARDGDAEAMALVVQYHTRARQRHRVAGGPDRALVPTPFPAGIDW